MANSESETKHHDEEHGTDDPSPTVSAGWPITGVAEELLIWVAKVRHLKPPCEMPRQLAAGETVSDLACEG
jgi:hypothetical protein